MIVRFLRESVHLSVHHETLSSLLAPGWSCKSLPGSPYDVGDILRTVPAEGHRISFMTPSNSVLKSDIVPSRSMESKVFSIRSEMEFDDLTLVRVELSKLQRVLEFADKSRTLISRRI